MYFDLCTRSWILTDLQILEILFEFPTSTSSWPEAYYFAILSYIAGPNCKIITLLVAVKYTDVEGVIRSPSYGGDKTSLYPNSLHLQWYIQVPEDHHILIWFSEPFHLEGVPGSCHDKLTRGSGLEVGLFTYLPGTFSCHARFWTNISLCEPLYIWEQNSLGWKKILMNG